MLGALVYLRFFSYGPFAAGFSFLLFTTYHNDWRSTYGSRVIGKAHRDDLSRQCPLPGRSIENFLPVRANRVYMDANACQQGNVLLVFVQLL